ncbi:MAG: hypothetical protein FJY92_06935 [Candidatus Hydrogenedentes bacterium]|nr:hypothetical protein [Candidatus Hydrogenedentota bacterium]
MQFKFACIVVGRDIVGILRTTYRAPVLVLVLVIDLSIICGTSPAMRLRTMIMCAGLKNARIVDYDYEHEGVALKL